MRSTCSRSTWSSGSNARFEDIDISIDGERVALIEYETGPAGGADGRGAVPMRTEPILIKAGQHLVAAAFVRKVEGPYEDLIRPHDWSFAGGGSGGPGITTLPHVRDLVIKGPYRATGISETASREKIFSCRPTSAAEERPCARQILSRIGSEAYRRPITPGELDRLMPLFDKAAAKGGFEAGVRSALEAILASPYFIFRMEKEPELAKPGGSYRVADVDLASRLSFFLWGTPPDQELLALANKGALSVPATLEKQTRRMLADPRAEALGSRFAGQWLRLQDIDKVHPDPNNYPNFDDNLAAAMRRETELFFNSLVREDRSVLDLYRANYTYVNDRLARHYGFPGVSGDEFRRVEYPDDTRRGLLGQGSVLVQTSLANRTSPVLRGKWVMEVLMGTPPPPPPPDIPTLEETAGAKDGKMLTTRERMEMHRANPTLHLVPPLHGSDWPGARQLRRHREVARARERDAARHPRRLLRRHAGDPAGGADRGAAEAPGAAGADVHREPDGLRDRAPRGVLRPARDSRDCEDGRSEPVQDVFLHPGRDQERCVSDEKIRADRDGIIKSRRRRELPHSEAVSAPHVSSRRGCDGGVAVPRRDGARGPQPRGRRGHREDAPDLHRRGARPGRLQQLGRVEVPLRARKDRPRLHASSPTIRSARSSRSATR